MLCFCDLDHLPQNINELLLLLLVGITVAYVVARPFKHGSIVYCLTSVSKEQSSTLTSFPGSLCR